MTDSCAALIDRYCQAWSDPDPARRRALLTSVWSEGATYTDPRMHATTPDQLLAYIDKVLAQRPGARLVRTSAVDMHHRVARFAWHLEQADGTSLPESLDVVSLSADGTRLDHVVGFFGPLARGS
jgi:hypothetical protein